jgi:glycosyltransferase involved in cell wall biosynthesis
MRTTPAISVITPTYNRCKSVMRAVATVLSQTYTDFEHIIVDDGSTDGTIEALRALRDPRLILLRLPERQGANIARNVGINSSRADIVTFLDSDDVFLPCRLRDTLGRFEADPDLELLISSFTTIRGSRQTVCANRQGHVDGPTLEKALAMQVIFIAGSAITVRRDSLIEIGAFDAAVQRMQDREMLLRYARRYGAFLSQEVDWTKHTSDDSISRQPDGYFDAYSMLLSKHPGLRERYPEAVRYITASRLVRALTKGHFAEAISGFHINRSSSAMGYSLLQLMWSLLMDRRQRRALRTALRAGVPASIEPVRYSVPATEHVRGGTAQGATPTDLPRRQ